MYFQYLIQHSIIFAKFNHRITKNQFLTVFHSFQNQASSKISIDFGKRNTIKNPNCKKVGFPQNEELFKYVVMMQVSHTFRPRFKVLHKITIISIFKLITFQLAIYFCNLIVHIRLGIMNIAVKGTACLAMSTYFPY